MQNRQEEPMLGLYGSYLRREVYPQAVRMRRNGLPQEEVVLIQRKAREKVNVHGHFGQLVGELQELTLADNLCAPDGKRELIGLQTVELVAGQNCRENLAAFMDIMDAIGRKFYKFNRPAVEKLLAAYREWLGGRREGKALRIARERLESWLARKTASGNGNGQPQAKTDRVAELRAEAERLKEKAAANFDAGDRASYKSGLLLEFKAIELEEEIEMLNRSGEIVR